MPRSIDAQDRMPPVIRVSDYYKPGFEADGKISSGTCHTSDTTPGVDYVNINYLRELVGVNAGVAVISRNDLSKALGAVGVKL